MLLITDPEQLVGATVFVCLGVYCHYHARQILSLACSSYLAIPRKPAPLVLLFFQGLK